MRGKEAEHAICKLSRKKQPKKLPHQENLRYPQKYTCSESTSENELVLYPTGSTKEDEYNVTSFYAMNYFFVSSIFNGEKARRDFPFKGWPEEHDIINLPQGKASILLIGRSGTGKTTCCLYRLWNQFQNHLMHISEVLPVTSQGDTDLEDCKSRTKYTLSDSFHQVFITKNYVLCDQMKKRFYDLAAANQLVKNHMDYEDAEIPTSLSDIVDYAYPLFLTARDFFILLDNSLKDDKCFFKRNDGNLAENIISSDYDHDDPDILLDLDDSDSDNDSDQDSNPDDEEFKKQSTNKKTHALPERQEITSSYFTEKIWPKIAPHDTKIDPLLVWMEIKSFIKGSRDAVEKKVSRDAGEKRDGHLSLEEYETLGRKMAPNYADKRPEIYALFKLYQKFVSQNKNHFDECDLNRSIYTRLNALKNLPFSIHSIYIDEVQDFTQAELSILIRICRNPNDLFLTGDTAQSIMRGVSFRFCDVKTIFHHAVKRASKSSNSTSIIVPREKNLTINFRSHAGVLKLADSVIDLLHNFSPNSFDHLPKERGIFRGPTRGPVILDSCKIGDLALVLKTYKRTTSSKIDFGAHQVIIVRSEEAKSSIPDLLNSGIVLTISEAKGLEFDDVLLYNFFRDSKVSLDLILLTQLI